MRPLFRVLLIVVSCSLLAASAAAADDADGPLVVTVDRALRLGPLNLPLPAFHDAETKGVTLEDLMDLPSLDVVTAWPHDGRKVVLARGRDAEWETFVASDQGFLLEAGHAAPRESWFAVYLTSDRWQEATLRVPAAEGVLVAAWLDGAPLDVKQAQGDEGAPLHTATMKLPAAKHLVLLRSAVPADLEGSWRLGFQVELGVDTPREALMASIDPARHADIHLVLDAPRVRDAEISPDGSLVAVALQTIPPGQSDPRRWLEIRRTENGEPVHVLRGDAGRGVQWAPDGRRVSFTVSEDGKTDLWLYDLESGAQTRLLRAIEDLQDYRWAPDGTFVVYEVQVEAKPDDRKVKRVENPADRQPWWRNRSYLVQASVPDGVTRRLTAGPLSPGNWEIAPDSQRLLFFLSDQDLAERPYFSSQLWTLDLVTLEATQVLADRWVDGAHWSPDGKRLLLQGSASAFDGLGSTLPADVQPNDYGGQLYLYDLDRGRPTPVSKALTPDVASSWWPREDGMIYALCIDQQFHRVYRRQAGTGDGAWERVDTGIDYVDGFALARDARVAVARGSDATEPSRVYAVDLEKNRAELLLEPGADAWQDVAFGDVERWQATLPGGEIIDGRIYFPPGFDSARTYPVIVYYYGGTSPVTVDFGGRYPKNVWAAQGYIVYVPEPSGATGYGQEFAARHVNDWGQRTATEVIEATRAFLAAHPYADGDHVGCIGASYGGFLTQFIVTQTDLFAAAISHAGISSISSYWGEGFWGYSYGARALADAFPWQDRDIYVEQSPLFHADRITTPLLLLHGTADTNVPVGESDQMFTALKLLGRDVEYVQIAGQNHWILDHEQRIVWNDTILAYFARYLKERPAWWEALYPAE